MCSLCGAEFSVFQQPRRRIKSTWHLVYTKSDLTPYIIYENFYVDKMVE